MPYSIRTDLLPAVWLLVPVLLLVACRYWYKVANYADEADRARSYRRAVFLTSTAVCLLATSVFYLGLVRRWDPIGEQHYVPPSTAS
jgi:hypothetical protein